MARLRWLAGAVAALSLGPAAAIAQADEIAEVCSGARLPFESPPFERFDRNGDERLTLDEVSFCDALQEVLPELDLDADGALSRAEYRGFADKWRRRVRTFDDDAL